MLYELLNRKVIVGLASLVAIDVLFAVLFLDTEISPEVNRKNYEWDIRGMTTLQATAEDFEFIEQSLSWGKVADNEAKSLELDNSWILVGVVEQTQPEDAGGATEKPLALCRDSEVGDAVETEAVGIESAAAVLIAGRAGGRRVVDQPEAAEALIAIEEAVVEQLE